MSANSDYVNVPYEPITSTSADTPAAWGQRKLSAAEFANYRLNGQPFQWGLILTVGRDDHGWQLFSTYDESNGNYLYVRTFISRTGTTPWRKLAVFGTDGSLTLPGSGIILK